MADAEAKPAEAPAQAAHAEKPKGKGNAILMVVVVILCVAGATLGSMFGPAVATHYSHKLQHEAEEKRLKAQESTVPAETISVDSVVVDILSRSGDQHHLKIGIVLELGKAIPEDEMKKLTPRVRDALIEWGRGQSVEDIRTKKTTVIREEITEEIQKVLGKSRVKQIRLTEFVMQ